MRKYLITIIAVFAVMFCQSESLSAQGLRGLLNRSTSKYSLEKGLQKGISKAVSKASEKTVSVEAMPQTAEEFEAMQSEVAQTPEGAVMMVIISMEMYRKDPAVGEECIKMANCDINFGSMFRRVKEIVKESDDSYCRPYQAAAFFKGADPDNGYNPTKPYTIRVRPSQTRKDERSQSLRGVVKFLEVYSDGFDSHWRSVEVVKQKGCDVYKVSNCPSIYTQCKEIDFECDREFEGL